MHVSLWMVGFFLPETGPKGQKPEKQLVNHNHDHGMRQPAVKVTWLPSA